MADLPCQNENCRSYGHPHPNCRCYGGNMAEGGHVERFCAKSQGHDLECQYYASGGPVMVQDPRHAVGHAAIQYGLSGLLKKVGQTDKDHVGTFMDAAHKGHEKLERKSKAVLGKKESADDSQDYKVLEEHLQYLKENPEALLNVGGSLANAAPAHGAQLAYTAAQGVNYLDSIKPRPLQQAPLDKITPAGQLAQERYHRQLNIAENPLKILSHINRGSLRPEDMATIQTLYPGLHQAMVSKMGERLIDAKGQVPYHQRRSLGILLGQPLDSTMTPAASQAIMKANLGAQAPQSVAQQKKSAPKKASGAELKQIDKVASLYQTATDKSDAR